MNPAASHPERIGRYEILLPIARGGVGIVYLTRAHGVGGFERNVALKLLHSHLEEGESHRLELIEEAKLAVLIRHPNVVQVFDVDEGPLGVFMAMEYIEGASLDGLIQAARSEGSRLPWEIGLRILLDALLGLHAAHELSDEGGRPLGLVHRDFSPHNLMVGVDGTTKLTDFGIAKASIRSSHTVTGVIKGKVSYMAPEQLRASRLDRRSDVWAAGMIAWQLLAGRSMYEADDDLTMMMKIARETPLRLRAEGVDVPVELDDAVARALAPDVVTRCPTAAAFARTIEATGVEVASRDDVAAYVRRLIGPTLEHRWAKVAAIVEQRKAVTSPMPVPPPIVLGSKEPSNPSTPRERGAHVWQIGAVSAISAFLIALGTWRAVRPASVASPAEAEPRPEAAPAEAALASSLTPVAATQPPAPPSADAPPEPSQTPKSDTPRLVSRPAKLPPSSAKVSPNQSARPLPLAPNPYAKP